MKILKITLVLVFPYLLVRPGLADHAAIIDQAYAEDASGQLTFAQARDLPTTSFTGPLFKGYTSSAIWVKLRVKKPGTAPRLFLTIRPQTLDHIELYDPDTPAAPQQATGDRAPWSHTEYTSLDNAFVLHFDGKEKEYWLRLRNGGSMAFDISVATRRQVDRLNRVLEFVYVIYIGIGIWFVIWSSGLYLNSRNDRILRSFAIHNLINLISGLSWLGYLRYAFSGWLQSAWFSTLSNVTSIALPFAYVLFNLELLKSSNAKPSWLNGLRAVLVLSCLAFLLLAIGATNKALYLNALLNCLSPAIMIGAAISTHDNKHGANLQRIPTIALVAHYIVMFAIVTVSGLAFLGNYNSHRYQIYFFILPSLLSGLLMASLLQWRSLRLSRLQTHISFRNRLLQHRLQLEQTAFKEQSQLMSMLAHEVKTPLSILRLATAMSLTSAPLQQHAEKAIVNIATIIDRCTRIFDDDPANPGKIFPAPCDILMELQALQAQKSPERISISGTAPSGFATDQDLLRILAGNLIDNALKYGHPDHLIEISIQPGSRKPDPGIIIEFSNAQGDAGLPDPQRLFDKFYRAPGAQSQSGAGLGLYIVKAVSKKLGGTIEYTPTTQHIRFRLWLPDLA